MTQTTRLGLPLLPAALLLGLLGDGLLRATPWGINILLWVSVLLGGGYWLARRLNSTLHGEGKWLAVPALVFAGGFAWRDSGTLRAVDFCGLLCCLGVGAARSQAGQIRLAGLWDYLGEIARSVFQSVFGIFPLLLKDIGWETVPRGGWLPRVLAAGRGLLLVLPLLLLFGALLTAADAVYQKLVAGFFHFDPSVFVGHFFLTLFVAVLTAGFGRRLLLPQATGPERLSKLPTLGTVEIATILGLLNLLFLSFVLVQLRYFFGGAATVASTAGLTYPQYARSGFFELVWVAALVLPLLLSLHRLQDTQNPRAQRLFSAQAAVQVVLLSVILASAMLRMKLYQDTCGLTELRFYTMAFMGWLAVVFFWFTLTVLRGRRQHFAFGAALAAFALIVGLHILNPDAVIVRTNAARMPKFDTDYVLSLSADAVPALVAALPSLPPATKAEVTAKLLPLYSRDPNDWRSWNWGRYSAFGAVHSQIVPLQVSLPPLTKSASIDLVVASRQKVHNLRQGRTP